MKLFASTLAFNLKVLSDLNPKFWMQSSDLKQTSRNQPYIVESTMDEETARSKEIFRSNWTSSKLAFAHETWTLSLEDAGHQNILVKSFKNNEDKRFSLLK